MSQYIIEGKGKVEGSLKIHGAKNAALPILAAAAICGDSVIHNCPDLTDISVAMEILGHLGCKAVRSGDVITTTYTADGDYCIPDHLMGAMRSSIVFLGGIVARHGQAEITLPGGCELGARPIDLHLMALRRMGAEIMENGDTLSCQAPKGLHGANIDLPLPSVGATENTIIAAVTAKGSTRLTGAAKEPEITDLITFLRGCGAKIQTDIDGSIDIEGVERLHGTEHHVIADRIAAGTYLCAAAMTGGEIELTAVDPGHLLSCLAYLHKAGCLVKTSISSVYLKAPNRLGEFGIIHTKPYPGFPTDMQSVMMASALTSRGMTVFVENIFESRFKHVRELQKLGADIAVEGRVAVVHGVNRLTGAEVSCTDLRGGAAVVLGAIAAEGRSIVREIRHIDRGYENFEGNLSALGIQITKEDTDEKKRSIAGR